MTPPRETIFAEWGDAVSAIAGSPGAPTAEAIKRLIFCGDQLSVALADEEERLATETAQREAAERALEAVTERIMRALVDGTRESLTANGLNDALDLVRRIADGGRAWRDTAGREHARLTAALIEAQRERDEARAKHEYNGK